MKTPRQILLEQNQQFDSRLENIQQAVIKNSIAAEKTRSELGNLVENIWKQIFLPARRIWLSYAFVWIAIVAVHLATADRAPTQFAKTVSPSEGIANWKEEQMILAELTKPSLHDPVDRPKSQPMRPRSEAYRIAIG